MNTSESRAAALERLYEAVIEARRVHQAYIAPLEGARSEYWAAEFDIEDALAAVEQAAPEGEFKERMEWWRDRWTKECADLADARAALREADRLLTVSDDHRGSPEWNAVWFAWLARPAVQASREEGTHGAR